MKKVLISLVLGLSLVGCATLEATKEPTDYNSVYSRVKLSQDEYVGSRRYIAPTIDLVPVKFGNFGFVIGTLDLVKKGQAERYCITTISYNKEWAFFEKAYDLKQQVFNVKNVDRSTSTLFNEVSVQEEDCIEVDKNYLNDAINNNGIDLKLIGKNKSVTFKIPSYYIKGFLDAVDYSEKKRFSN